MVIYHTRLEVFPGELSADWRGSYSVIRVINGEAVEVEKEG